MPVNDALLHGPFYGNYFVRLAGAIGFAYLFCSIPYRSVAVWLFGDFDARIASSTRGLAPVLDWMKAGLAVAIAAHGGGIVVGCAAAAAAVAGHALCPWMKFRGPSAAAVVLGSLTALAWPAAVFYSVLWFALAFASGYVALATLGATALGVLTLWFFCGPAGAFAGVAMLVIAGMGLRDQLVGVRDATEPVMRRGGDRSEASVVYLERQAVQSV